MAKHAMWVSGHQVVSEDPGLSIERRGWGATVSFPAESGRQYWFHFAIPTPVVVADRRVNLTTVWVLFNTRSRTEIKRIDTWDGPKPIGRDELNRHGDHSGTYDSMNRVDIRHAGMQLGLGVSVWVRVVDGPPGGPIELPQILFTAAGADFDV